MKKIKSNANKGIHRRCVIVVEIINRRINLPRSGSIIVENKLSKTNDTA